ncbi:MAG: VWA domain-containing protein [Myxococcota bacterium]|nr:VWA domain-containing protein [Myxococcota bacterium]
MCRWLRDTIVCLLTLAGASAAWAERGELRLEIREPRDGSVLPSRQGSVQVQGAASVFGAVRYLDLFLVVDTSKSLLRTDPKDFRKSGAIGLVKSLPDRDDIQIGVVDFDRKGDLLAPLTADRQVVIDALRELDRSGSTDIAAGVQTAMLGFEDRAREGSSRVILLFTDGKTSDKKARKAMEMARLRGVAVHTVMLGKDRKASEILSKLARGTRGSFVRVDDPAKLPDAFLNLRTTGVERVVLHVNGQHPISTRLVAGQFEGDVNLRPGPNRIVAVATGLDGTTRDASVTVNVTDEVHVRIETPLPDTVFTNGEREAVVSGRASLFENAPPELLAAHPDHGIERVVLRVDDSPPFATTLGDGRFEGRVMLHEGENRLLATVTTADGRVADTAITVTVRAPGCGALEVKALRDGRPALSVSERAVEIVFDASNSMWGRMQGRPKMTVAQETLSEALHWMPPDLDVALRAYGHQHRHQQKNCQDSELLVPFQAGNRILIERAVAGFKPRGQTPLAYSLEQVARDFAGVEGERAVVLVTDGIESCGGDPVAAARALQKRGPVPVHVIGFGLGKTEDEDAASLRAIAEASGGRFVTAGSAEELRDALSATVGTAFRVIRGGRPVAKGSLGAEAMLHLPPGDYELALESAPPVRVPVTMAAEEKLVVTLERRGGRVSHSDVRWPTEYAACGPGGVAIAPQRAPRPAAIDD